MGGWPIGGGEKNGRRLGASPESSSGSGMVVSSPDAEAAQVAGASISPEDVITLGELGLQLPLLGPELAAEPFDFLGR